MWDATSGAALKLFDAAGGCSTPGGELWTVFNTHLAYANALTRAVGPTQVVGVSTRFTATVSTRR